MEANADSTRTMYESFVTRLRETQGQDSIEMGDARIISHASVPTMPSSPKRLILSGASIPAGLLLGFLCALLMERFGEGLAAGLPERAPRLPTMPVLARIPGASALGSADLVADHPSSPFAQALRAMALQLTASAQSAPRLVVVTSNDPQSGQTNVSIGLARSLAALHQRVVLVDGNLRSPVASWTMRLADGAPGMLDVLGGTSSLSRSLARDPKSNLCLLGSTQQLSDASAVWSSRPMTDLMAHLRRNCSIVIVDAPRWCESEMRGIACFADAIIFVSRPHEQAGIAASVDALSAVSSAPIGLVLTS